MLFYSLRPKYQRQIPGGKSSTVEGVGVFIKNSTN